MSVAREKEAAAPDRRVLYLVPLLATTILTLVLLAYPFLRNDTIDTREAGDHIGRVKTVCGKVIGGYHARDETGEPTFLDLDGREYPKNRMTVVIWGENRDKFKLPEILYHERRICVTGQIRLYREKPQIAVSEPEQIEVEKPLLLTEILWPSFFGAVISGALQLILQGWTSLKSAKARPRAAQGQRKGLGASWIPSWPALLVVTLSGGALAWAIMWLFG